MIIGAITTHTTDFIPLKIICFFGIIFSDVEIVLFNKKHTQIASFRLVQQGGRVTAVEIATNDSIFVFAVGADYLKKDSLRSNDITITIFNIE